MPVLMEKNDLEEAFENASRSRHVWRERVIGDTGENFVHLPTTGAFEVIFIEIPTSAASVASATSGTRIQPRISDFIGYGRRFHPEYRSTEDVM